LVPPGQAWPLPPPPPAAAAAAPPHPLAAAAPHTTTKYARIWLFSVQTSQLADGGG